MEKIPFTPAVPEGLVIDHENPLDDARVCRSVIAALLVKGGAHTVAITQADLDAVAKLVLLDGRTGEGDFMVALGMRDPDGVIHPFHSGVVQGH